MSSRVYLFFPPRNHQPPYDEVPLPFPFRRKRKLYVFLPDGVFSLMTTSWILMYYARMQSHQSVNHQTKKSILVGIFLEIHRTAFISWKLLSNFLSGERSIYKIAEYLLFLVEVVLCTLLYLTDKYWGHCVSVKIQIIFFRGRSTLL